MAWGGAIPVAYDTTWNAVSSSWTCQAANQCVPPSQVALLAQQLLALEEPWQGRFLNLVALLATRWTWEDDKPTSEELAKWLAAPQVYHYTGRLLAHWQGRADTLPT
jgi:hypothetical protein